MSRARLLLFAGLALLGACAAELPPVDSIAFACVGDEPIDGELQCPPTHWCAGGTCTPRLGCFEPDATELGCTEGLRRCELTSSDLISATRCGRGVHTETSSPAPDNCACSAGLACMALAEVATASSASQLPLYVLRERTFPVALTAAAVGATGEKREARACTRACTGELDCPAQHTCRLAAVLYDSTINGLDQGRHTVGVCVPDLLVGTSTPADQPDPTICRSRYDCRTRVGRADGECVAQVDTVGDHPARPAGVAWGTHLAVVPHCAGPAPAGSVPDGMGCTSDAVCASGECEDGRCRALCDPSQPAPCANGRPCLPYVVEHQTTQGLLRDRLFLCERG